MLLSPTEGFHRITLRAFTVFPESGRLRGPGMVKSTCSRGMQVAFGSTCIPRHVKTRNFDCYPWTIWEQHEKKPRGESQLLDQLE
jgi:hypothetical protein